MHLMSVLILIFSYLILSMMSFIILVIQKLFWMTLHLTFKRFSAMNSKVQINSQPNSNACFVSFDIFNRFKPPFRDTFAVILFIRKFINLNFDNVTCDNNISLSI